MLAVFIFGLEKDILQSSSPGEKVKFFTAAILYLGYCVLAIISGYSFFNLIAGSWKMGILGAAIFLIVFGVLHHVILNTIKKSPKETLPKTWKRFIPHSGQVFRLLYSLFFALILSFPITALVSPEVVKIANTSAERKVEARISGVGIPSSDFNSTLQAIGPKNPNHTAAIFNLLSATPQLYLVLILTFLVAIFPAILLRRLNESEYYREFDRQKNNLILSNYHQIVESVTNEEACAIQPDQKESLEKLKVWAHPEFKREEKKTHNDYSEEAYKRILGV
jgi:hypothetical protein